MIVKLQKETVFIVMYRPDLGEEHSVKDYALALLPIVEQAEASLKVPIVHRAELWDWEENEKESSGKA
ncbi:Nn.00g114890.m01.CDS01 [Neocucurbitaria sp. VM-36]